MAFPVAAHSAFLSLEFWEAFEQRNGVIQVVY
jgi:hypothetical protein